MNIKDFIAIPEYSITLPISKQTIRYRPFLVKEQKVLLQIQETESDDSTKINNVLSVINECLFNEIDSRNLNITDFEILFLNIRAKSESSEMHFKAKCDHCQHENLTSINIGDLKTDIKDVDNIIKINDKLFIEMKYPDINSVLDIDNKDVVAMVKICIKSFILGDTVYHVEQNSSDDVMEFLDYLTTDQFKKLKEFIENIPQNYIPLKFKCNKCGEETDKKINGLMNFFI